VAIINAIIATMLINARQIYATGRDGVWPPSWNRAVTRTHHRFQSPWIATLIAGALAAAACFIPLGKLITLTATGIIGTYALVCVSALVGRATGSTDLGHYRMPFFPLAPVLALLALAGVVAGAWIDPTDGGKESLAANLAIMGGFAGYYLLFLRRRGRWALRGPEGAL
jgi:amino acid transporter